MRESCATGCTRTWRLSRLSFFTNTKTGEIKSRLATTKWAESRPWSPAPPRRAWPTSSRSYPASSPYHHQAGRLTIVAVVTCRRSMADKDGRRPAGQVSRWTQSPGGMSATPRKTLSVPACCCQGVGKPDPRYRPFSAGEPAPGQELSRQQMIGQGVSMRRAVIPVDKPALIYLTAGAGFFFTHREPSRCLRRETTWTSPAPELGLYFRSGRCCCRSLELRSSWPCSTGSLNTSSGARM